MRAVSLVDTSILCELLRIPGKTSDPERFRAEFVAKVTAGEALLLPLAAVIETGNHIAQSGDGGSRRRTATELSKIVRDALDGRSPFHPIRHWDADKIGEWLDEFPDWVMRSDERGKGSGLADLTIKKEWEQVCLQNPGRRVYIWSLDAHLSACDKGPEIG